MSCPDHDGVFKRVNISSAMGSLIQWLLLNALFIDQSKALDQSVDQLLVREWNVLLDDPSFVPTKIYRESSC